MKDITIDGVTLTYDEKTDYYIEYDEDGSISGMIDGSFGEDEAIKTFKGARAECKLAKKFINNFGFEVGFEKDDEFYFDFLVDVFKYDGMRLTKEKDDSKIIIYSYTKK